MTIEDFISTFGRGPDAVEEKWLRFISPLKVKVGNKFMTVPFCQAFCYTESDRRLYPIPLEVQILIYGEEVPGLDLQQFSITSKLNLTEDWFCFQLSANYAHAPKPPCRDFWTTAQDCEDWLGYVASATGQTIDDLLTIDEYKQLEPGE